MLLLLLLLLVVLFLDAVDIRALDTLGPVAGGLARDVLIGLNHGWIFGRISVAFFPASITTQVLPTEFWLIV